jgi:hypothetical protein
MAIPASPTSITVTVAEAAAIALAEDRLLDGTFDLCAEGWLNRKDVAATIGEDNFLAGRTFTRLKPKRIQNSCHLVSSLSPARRSATNLCEFKQIEFSDYTAGKQVPYSHVVRNLRQAHTYNFASLILYGHGRGHG